MRPEPFKYRQIEAIRVVVTGHNTSGSPDFYACIVSCNKEQYNDGMHYEKASDQAEELGFDEKTVCFDEYDNQDWLFHRFDWETAPSFNIGPKFWEFTYKVRTSGLTVEEAEDNATKEVALRVSRGDFNSVSIEPIS